MLQCAAASKYIFICCNIKYIFICCNIQIYMHMCMCVHVYIYIYIYTYKCICIIHMYILHMYIQIRRRWGESAVVGSSAERAGDCQCASCVACSFWVEFLKSRPTTKSTMDHHCRAYVLRNRGRDQELRQWRQTMGLPGNHSSLRLTRSWDKTKKAPSSFGPKHGKV